MLKLGLPSSADVWTVVQFLRTLGMPYLVVMGAWYTMLEIKTVKWGSLDTRTRKYFLTSNADVSHSIYDTHQTPAVDGTNSKVTVNH